MKISTWCHIENNSIHVNGEKVFPMEEATSVDFFKLAYKNLEIDYPKYYKMDGLCKLGILCSEWVFKQSKVLESADKENIAIHISNKSSSLESDTMHQNALSKDGMVSPAVFVYTLPNIVIGEISIRNGIKGDHCFYIKPTFDAGFLHQNAESLSQIDAPDAILTGWIEYYDGKYHGFLYLLEKNGEINHTKENINALYQRIK